MPTVVGTVALIDAESITRLMRSLDISGTGGGPWVPQHNLVDRYGDPIDRDNPFPAARAIKHSFSSFARPNNVIAYSTGDIVTDAASGSSFASAVPSLKPARLGSGWTLQTLRLRKNTVGATNATFRVHLFKAVPTAIALDNVAFAATGNAAYLGVSGEATMIGMGNGANVILPMTLSHRFDPSDESIWWLLEVRGAYTPVAAENFELEMVVAYD